MGLLSLLSSAIWLSLYLSVYIIQLAEHLLGIQLTIISRLAQLLVDVMAPFLSANTLAKLKGIVSWRSPSVISGSKADTLYQIPVFQRSDGVTLKLGYMVLREEEGVVYTIRNIMVRADLSEVTVTLSPVEIKNGKMLEMKNEEMVCGVEEVLAVKGRSVALGVARDGMELVSRCISTCPIHVQKLIRKHQLSVAMRKEVQKFLGGFSMSGNISLGCVDWRLDPTILGLERETEFSLEYRVERFVEQTSHMDLMMGKEWDVKTLSGTDGYRIILTLEMMVDSNQELVMKMHATLVSGKLDPNSYRTVSLKDTTSTHTACARRLSDITQNGTGTNNHGLTLAWDEFQTHSADNSPCRAGAVPSVTVSMDDMLSSFPTSSTAFHSLERLLSSIPQSQLVFNSPIKEVSGEYTHLSTTSGTGPNTSTPADDLDQSGDHSHSHSRADAPDYTPQSSPSLQGHRTVEENVTKQAELEVTEDEVGCINFTDIAAPDVFSKDKSITPVPFEQIIMEITEDIIEDNLLNQSNGVENNEEGEKMIYPFEIQDVRQDKPTTPESEENMQTSPDALSDKDSYTHEVKVNEVLASECIRNGVDDIEASDDSITASDAVKPSPNISMDEISNPGKAQFLSLESESLPTEFSQHQQNNNLDSNPLLSSPPKNSSLSRVQEYLQSLPSPGRRDTMPDTPNSKHPSYSNSSNLQDDELDTSICSESHSVASRQSDLSSLTGSRLGRGLFYGSSASVNPTAPICPFPEDWQFNTIPEVIENDDELD